MSAPSYKNIIKDGLWTSNPGLVQILGLCPLLAVSSTFINALGLGVATAVVLMSSNFTVSVIRNWVKPELRISVFVMIIASIVTAVELAMNAYWHELYKVLGIFIPLIVTNCIIIARAESFAAKNDPIRSAVDGLMMGTGFMLVLLLLGAIREIIGQGTLFAGAQLMFGPEYESMKIVVIESYRGFLLAILPPGAFMVLGVLIAIKNRIDFHQKTLARKNAARETVLPEQAQSAAS